MHLSRHLSSNPTIELRDQERTSSAKGPSGRSEGDPLAAVNQSTSTIAAACTTAVTDAADAAADAAPAAASESSDADDNHARRGDLCYHSFRCRRKTGKMTEN